MISPLWIRTKLKNWFSKGIPPWSGFYKTAEYSRLYAEWKCSEPVHFEEVVRPRLKRINKQIHKTIDINRKHGSKGSYVFLGPLENHLPISKEDFEKYVIHHFEKTFNYRIKWCGLGESFTNMYSISW